MKPAPKFVEAKALLWGRDFVGHGEARPDAFFFAGKALAEARR